jgi:hypothetical protein
MPANIDVGSSAVRLVDHWQVVNYEDSFWYLQGTDLETASSTVVYIVVLR